MISIRLLCITLAVIIPFVSTNGNSSTTLPCEYHDSINITAGQHNGSKIVFDGITFGPDQYATVGFVLNKQSKLVTAASHVRGCICNIKLCIRTCCPHGHLLEYKDGAPNCVQNIEMKNSHFPIQMQNGTVSGKDHFTVVHGHPPHCDDLFSRDEYAIHDVSFSINTY